MTNFVLYFLSKDFIPQESMKEFAASMYSIVNDSYRSTLCLQYQPEDIAMAAFYIASLQLSLRPVSPSTKLPLDKSWVDILDNIQEYLLRGNDCHSIKNVSSHSLICYYFFFVAISLEIIEMYDQKTYILEHKERIESEIHKDKLNTVSNSTTPSITTPGSTMLGSANMVLTEYEEEHHQRKVTVTVYDNQKGLPQKQVTTSTTTTAETVTTTIVLTPHSNNTVSPVSVHPVIDGSDSSYSNHGFSDETPVYNQDFAASDTPLATSRFDSLPKYQMRERSNSLTEYTAHEIKRARVD